MFIGRVSAPPEAPMAADASFRITYRSGWPLALNGYVLLPLLTVGMFEPVPKAER